MVKTAVLFETFARVDYARQVFDAIKKARPQKLYFYSNKARSDRTEELRENEEIRSWVKEVDWPCDLHTYFRQEYTDIYHSLLGSKNWVFENEEEAIILEDDCVPSMAFFEFCDHFLELYKENHRIGFITGNNYTHHFPSAGEDHFITRSVHHFGWATWKDRWKMIDFSLDPREITSSNCIRDYFKGNSYLGYYYTYYYKELTPFILRTHCWDYEKVLNQFKYKWLAVSPVYNLVKNIGIEGTHAHHAKGLAFDSSNGSEFGDYQFAKGQRMEITPNVDYDANESRTERIRNFLCLLKLSIQNRLQRL